MSESESDYSDEDIELQEAFSAGLLKPGLNKVDDAPKQIHNNVKGMQLKLQEIKLNLPWIESLDSINKEAPLAPELAAKLLSNEQKRENQLKNNKKLKQFTPEEDPILNDFKREMSFYRQAQAAVLDNFPKLKSMGMPLIRPDDYFAEMAKTDSHMQKIRESLMQKQAQQQRSERVKELRTQRKEGKALQAQKKVERNEEKRLMLEQIKKARKGTGKDLSFLDGKPGMSRKAVEKRKLKDKKFGFGGKKKGLKSNTKESAADIADYRNPGKQKVSRMGGKKMGNKNIKNRPGKNRRVQKRAKGRK